MSTFSRSLPSASAGQVCTAATCYPRRRRLALCALFAVAVVAICVPCGRAAPPTADQLRAADDAIARDPRSPAAHDARGALRFKAGRIAESLADFNRAIALDPTREPGHWMRGISFYYAGEYEKGAKQFAGYQTVDSNDVENAVWRFLCVARSSGLDKARQDLLPIKHDSRVPLMTVYALFAGKAQPADVLAAVKQGNPAGPQLTLRQFYADLYLGLYYESQGNAKLAKQYIQAARDARLDDHYMADVARVHADRLDSSQQKSTPAHQPPSDQADKSSPPASQSPADRRPPSDQPQR